MKRIILFLISLISVISANAQIGYQVSLLNTATGEPRANETVSCTAALSGQKSTIFTSTQNITSNEFGVLSLTIGNADMFKNVDWAAELPLFVEVAVDGKTIAKSQVLSVPVAEAAKVLVPEINLVGKTIEKYNGEYSTIKYIFLEGGKLKWVFTDNNDRNEDYEYTGHYCYLGSGIWVLTYNYYEREPSCDHDFLRYVDGKFYIFN